jgi:hypothetical protein
MLIVKVNSLLPRILICDCLQALLHGLDLNTDMNIRIHSTADKDRLSQGVEVIYTPSMQLLEKNRGRKGGTQSEAVVHPPEVMNTTDFPPEDSEGH